jgi:Zn-dependent protease
MFRLLGFDVHVRTGFVVFLALIVFLYQDAFGLWLAGGIAVFTLVHELGHAVAARSAGADAEISLEFLAGYTSFRADPSRPLRPGQRALISVAGPAVHIAVSAAVLVAMGVNPFSLDSVGRTDQAAALWWAGPAIGAMNLIPVLPLDGGHLALTGVETVVGDKAVRYVAIASLVVTVGGAVYMFGTDRPGFALFIAFLLINQIQILAASGSRRGKSGPPNRAAAAEAQAWATGRPGILEPGQRLSPWYEAHRALLQGDEGGAMGVMLADLRSTSVRNWAAPGAATPQQLRAIVDVLPAELPHGNPYSSRVLAEILLALGDRRRAGSYAASAFAAHRHAPLAVVVARAAAAMGDQDNAVMWLAAGADAADGNRYIGLVMDQAPELASLRARPDYEAIRSRVA